MSSDFHLLKAAFATAGWLRDRAGGGRYVQVVEMSALGEAAVLPSHEKGRAPCAVLTLPASTSEAPHLHLSVATTLGRGSTSSRSLHGTLLPTPFLGGSSGKGLAADREQRSCVFQCPASLLQSVSNFAV